MTNFMSKLGLIIKNRRKELGLTQQELADKLDKTRVSLIRLESGQIKDLHLNFFLSLCKELSLTPHSVFSKAMNQNSSNRLAHPLSEEGLHLLFVDVLKLVEQAIKLATNKSRKIL
jgi:transcriptional regulator with XRE-family HTH domain